MKKTLAVLLAVGLISGCASGAKLLDVGWTPTTAQECIDRNADLLRVGFVRNIVDVAGVAIDIPTYPIRIVADKVGNAGEKAYEGTTAHRNEVCAKLLAE